MTDKELLQEALESIEWLRLHLGRDHGCLHMKPAVSGIPDWLNKTEAALRARLSTCDRCGKVSPAELHTCTPPQREWVGLTDEEYEAIRYGHDENGEPYVDYELFEEGEYGTEVNIYIDDFYRAIEAKLKEKNSDL